MRILVALALPMIVACGREPPAAPTCRDVARRAAYWMAQGLKVGGEPRYPDVTAEAPPEDLVRLNEELCQREPFTEAERRCMIRAVDLDAWNACAP